MGELEIPRPATALRLLPQVHHLHPAIPRGCCRDRDPRPMQLAPRRSSPWTTSALPPPLSAATVIAMADAHTLAAPMLRPGRHHGHRHRHHASRHDEPPAPAMIAVATSAPMALLGTSFATSAAVVVPVFTVITVPVSMRCGDARGCGHRLARRVAAPDDSGNGRGAPARRTPPGCARRRGAIQGPRKACRRRTQRSDATSTRT